MPWCFLIGVAPPLRGQTAAYVLGRVADRAGERMAAVRDFTVTQRWPGGTYVWYGERTGGEREPWRFGTAGGEDRTDAEAELARAIETVLAVPFGASPFDRAEMEYGGVDTAAGRPAWVLWSRAGGEIGGSGPGRMVMYIDTLDLPPRRIELRSISGGGMNDAMSIVVDLGDSREVQRFPIPFRRRVTLRGNPPPPASAASAGEERSDGRAMILASPEDEGGMGSIVARAGELIRAGRTSFEATVVDARVNAGRPRGIEIIDRGEGDSPP